jgi:hypothetical protein
MQTKCSKRKLTRTGGKQMMKSEGFKDDHGKQLRVDQEKNLFCLEAKNTFGS